MTDPERLRALAKAAEEEWVPPVHCTKCGNRRRAKPGERTAVCDRCPYMMIPQLDEKALLARIDVLREAAAELPALLDALQEAQERGDRYEAALREIEDPLLSICPYFSGDAERLSEACDTIDAALNPPATPTNRYDAENAAIQQCAQAYDTESCVVQVVDKFARPIPPEAPDA